MTPLDNYISKCFKAPFHLKSFAAFVWSSINLTILNKCKLTALKGLDHDFEFFFRLKKSFDDNWWTLFSSIKQFWNLFDFMNFNAVSFCNNRNYENKNLFHALKFTYFREFIYVCHVAKKSLPRHLDIVAWLIAPLWLKDTEKGNVVIINYSCVSKWAYDELTLFEKRRTTFFCDKSSFFFIPLFFIFLYKSWGNYW